MISLIGRHPDEPALLSTESLNSTKELTTKAARLVTHIFKESDFPNYWGKHKHLFFERQYKGKCAYCETDIFSGSPGDVEHFRPKAYCQSLGPVKSRDDCRGKSPGRKTSGTATEGYWWLAYKWSNYLLSCNRCNAVWKKNQFPLNGPKAKFDTALTGENCLIINPFEVDPEPHFEFNVYTGQIKGLSPEGAATIEVCGLDRRSLEIQRAIKGEKLLKRHREYLYALNNKNLEAQNNTLNAILDECRSKSPFAAVARYFANKHLALSYPELLKMKRAGAI